MGQSGGVGIRRGAPLLAPQKSPALVLARDHGASTVASQVRLAQVVRVHRGAYLPSGDWTPREKTLAQITAVHEQLKAPHWFSHESAAAAWGLLVWEEPDVVHVRTQTTGAKADGLHRHRGALPPDATTQVNALPVTTLAQTVVDCARTLPVAPAMVVADSALRAGMDRAEALQLLASCQGKGVRRAATVLRYADGGAESQWETATRVLLLHAGLPVPSTQVKVETRLGPFWVDLAILEWHLLLEFDGQVKYTDRDVLFAEKRRADAIAERGDHLARITAADHRHPQALVTRLLRHAPPGFRPTPRPELSF
ncbi:MAG: hypothetical protein FWD11_02215 [Micrococcales bacterium]|nr:hypothetical protein [Micrococcales bacterium]